MMRTRCLIVMLLALMLIAVGASSAWAVAWTGSLTSPSGIDGTGVWVVDNGESGWFPATISWTVTQGSSSWNYDYTFSVYNGATSHFILEVSEAFTEEDIFNVLVNGNNFNNYSIGQYGQGSGNPGIPDDIFGIKFDSLGGSTTLHINFDSTKAPVWGDFYAKDGKVGGTVNTAWNAGFTNPDTDPIGPPSNGSSEYHILVPDTNGGDVVPEPSTVLMLSAGLAGVAGFLRRRA